MCSRCPVCNPNFKNTRRHIRLVQIFYQAGLVTTLFIFIILSFSVDKLYEESKDNVSRPVIVWYTDRDQTDIFGMDGAVWWLPDPDRATITCPTDNSAIGCDIIPASKYYGKPAGYLFYGSFLNHLPLPRDPKSIWALVNEETPNNMVALMYEEVLNLFNFSATFSRHSDAPMPLLYMQSLDDVTNTFYFVNTSTKNSFLSDIAPVLYLQTNCDTQTDRDDYIKTLMQFIPIDSYGKCVHNKQFPNELSHYRYQYGDHLNHVEDHFLLQFIARYKFVVAIENAVCEDYVTEKFWRAIRVGVVPIYYGSPLIRDWLPNNKSAILLQDYPTPELLGQHLYEMLQNDTKYEEYLDHKTKGLITNERVLNEMKERPYQTDLFENLNKLYCLMCNRIHEFDINSTQVNIVTKKHYNCSMPTSALTQAENPDNIWYKRILKAKKTVDYIHVTLSTS